MTGKTPAPDMTIDIPPSEEELEGLVMPNPKYDVWAVADQHLVGWLYNSMAPEVAAQVMGHDEAKSLWDSIQEYFGIHSRSQEDYNRLMLQQTRKGTMKMYEYLETMKKYFDNLLIAGCPMDMRSFISHITAGLDEEYTPIVCIIRSQNMSWFAIQQELLTYELRMDRLQNLKGTITVNQASVNYANVERAKVTNTSSYTPQQSRSYSSSSNRGGRYRGRGRYHPYSSNKPTCQICGKVGHTAVICHFRYEKPENSSSHNNINVVSQPPTPSEPNTALMAFP